MLWKMEAEAGIQEHLLCKLEEPLGAQNGWLPEGPATRKACFWRTAGLAANFHLTPRPQKDPLLSLPLSKTAFCLSVLSICPVSLSSKPTLQVPFTQSLSFTPGLTRDTPWSLSLQSCPASPPWGLISHDPDLSSHPPPFSCT